MPMTIPMPSDDLIELVGGGKAEGYRQVSQHFFEIFKKHGGLMPHDRVLDVGCGCGRMAASILPYLTSGVYEGFDVIPSLVDWCRANIVPLYPTARFQQVDLYNKTYFPKGTIQPKDFRFPYPDNAFDFTFLTSVFTHMLPPDMTQYVREIQRTLAPGGRALVTYFLINAESARLKDTKASRLKVRKPFMNGQVLVMKRRMPEAAVAYPEDTVRRIFRENGLTVRDPILYGHWCGREEASTVSYQDIVIVEKKQ